MRVLLTGMSGTGKTTLVHELRRRGHEAVDADEDGFSTPGEDGRWGWRVERVAAWLAAPAPGHDPRPRFFAGCAEEQGGLPFDVRVLLSAPEATVLERLRTRTTNAYGRGDAERAQVLADLAEVEPLLRRSADLELDSSRHTVAELADAVLAHVAAREDGGSAGASPARA